MAIRPISKFDIPGFESHKQLKCEIDLWAVRQVQHLESKNLSPAKTDTLEKLAKAFKITISRLLDF